VARLATGTARVASPAPVVRECPSNPPRQTQTEAGDDSYASGVRRVVSVEPIFVVSDVPRAVAHYEQLGFNTSQHDEGYAFAHRNELTIHLAGPGVDPERVGRGSIYMHVDDADAPPRNGEVPVWTSSSPGTSSTASVKAHTKIPTGTLFASDHPFGARAVYPSRQGERLRPARVLGIVT
jgi:hypothetical protein